MSGSAYMTVAGLLYLFAAAVILCRVFFDLANNVNEYIDSSGALKNGLKSKLADKLLDVAIALPLLVIGIAAQGLGLMTSGGLNILGVILLLGLAFALLYYAGMKDVIVEGVAAKRPAASVRELPAPAARLPRPEASPEARATATIVEQEAPAAAAPAPASNGKPVSQPRKTG